MTDGSPHLETRATLCSPQTGEWAAVFPDGSAPLSLFQAAHLVSAPAEMIHWSLPGCPAGLRLTLSSLYYLSTLGRADPTESNQVGALPELILGWTECFNPGGHC